MKAGRQNQAGFSLVEVVVAGVICLASVMALERSIRSNRAVASLVMEKVQAEQYAAELLEYFRSLSSSQLRAYLTATSSPAYPLCSYINIADTAQKSTCDGTFVQRDARVDLPASELGPSICQALPCAANPSVLCYQNRMPNRFYSIQIVDQLNNMAPSCGTVSTVLTADQRYLVTVGVSWFGPTDTAKRQQVQLSTVLTRTVP